MAIGLSGNRQAAADAIVAAGTPAAEEVFVPRELGPIAPADRRYAPGIADRLKSPPGDSVMIHADMGARAAHTQRVEEELQVSELLRRPLSVKRSHRWC